MNTKIEGSPVCLVLADHDSGWMMEAAQELSVHPQIKVIGFAQNGKTLVERATDMVADAVLTDMSLPDMMATEATQRLAEDSPGTAVFCVTNSMSASLVQAAKSAGIVEVFPKDNFVAREVADRICAHVDSLRKEWNEISQKHGIVGKGIGPRGEKTKKEYVTRVIKQTIVLTYNIKGGVGKSTVAANLAVAIKLSPYLSGQRICLVDFDCGGCNVITNVHLTDADAANRNIAIWDHVPEDLSAKEVDELLIKGPHGVMVAAAPINQAMSERISLKLADKILRMLKKYYSVIIIDGAPNVSAPIDAAFQHSTHVLLVANAEGQSVKQLARTIELLSPDPNFPEKADMNHLLRKTFLVLNHAQAPTKYDLKKSDVASIIGRPLFAEIPYDEIVRKALHGNTEKLPVELDPTSPFAMAIKSLANDLCGAYPEGKVLNRSKGVLGKFTNKLFSRR